jgi:hypothetical protein
MQIKKQIQEVLATFPTLHFDAQKNAFTGTLEVNPNDFYTVLIDINLWNTNFPRVYEIGERIKRKLDRHIYTDLGNCCFTTPRIQEILLKTKVKTLLQFVKHIVIPYFQNNSYYELHKEYINGEFSHTDATLETYQTLLKIEDRELITKTLYQYHKGKKLTNKDDCYCGSKRTLRKCANGNHKLGHDTLKHIEKKNIEMDLRILLHEIVEENKKNANT